MSSLTTTIPAGSWVLVTGATGFVASHVTRQFLERRYKVRGTVRDLTQASWLVDDHFKSYVDSGDLELVAVPDLAVDGAFNEAVNGVSAIAHIATITSFDPNPNNVIPQTVAGVTSILKAATKEPSVQEIVFTSSIMAAILPLAGDDTRVDRDTWNEAAVQAAWAAPPYEPSRAMFTYAASKVAAEKEIWNFIEENKPHYTVNAICPSGIVGEPLHKKHAETPANWVATLFKGDKASLDPWPAGKTLSRYI
jgi:nucleoside-diphosphate-sugar epimerase